MRRQKQRKWMSQSQRKATITKEKSARPDVKSKFEAIKQKLLAVKEKFIDSKAGIQKIKNKIDYWKNLLTSDPMKEAMEFLWKKQRDCFIIFFQEG